MKKIKILFIFILLIIGIDSIKAFDNTKKVYDYAQILTSKEENKLYTKINKFTKKFSMDMVLVTVRYHEKEDSDSYAKDFYNINNFGLDKEKSGVIFIIDLNFKNERIGFKTFGNTKKIFNNIRITELKEDISNNKSYYDKCNTFISKSIEYANKGVETSLIESKHILSNIPLLKIFLLSLITPFIITIIYILKNLKKDKSYYEDSHVLDGSVDINIRSDKFITTSTETKRND